MERDGHPRRGRRGVWRQGREEGQGGSRAERFARGPCSGSASRVAGGGDRRGDRRRRRRGLEDFGKERPKVQHSDLHISVLAILSQTLPEPQDHGKPGFGAPSTAARRNRDKEAPGGAEVLGSPHAAEPRGPLVRSPRRGKSPGAQPCSTWDSPSRCPNDLQIAEAAGCAGGCGHALRGAIPSLPWCCEAPKSQGSGSPRRGRAAAASASATAG